MTSSAERARGLQEAWLMRGQMGFDAWIRLIAGKFELSALNLESAARLVGASPAEFQGALQLSGLEDAELALLAACRPPSTTWFKFAKLAPADFPRAIHALQALPPSAPPSSAFAEFDSLEIAVNRASLVAALPASVFKHLASKSKQYNLLYDRARKALFEFGRRRDKGLELSTAQANWADNMILELIEKAAIRRDSPDGDQEICAQILAIYGR